MTSALECFNLSLRFGGLVALADVSMQVGPGSICAVIGPNGAGKSTLINVLSGRYRMSSGRIVIAGRDVTGAGPERFARLGVGRTFQVTSVFAEHTVADNLIAGVQTRLGRQWNAAPWRRRDAPVMSRVRRIARMTALEGHLDQLVGTLSHGTRRSVELALALTLEPSVLLLDEPMAGVPDLERAGMVDLIVGSRLAGLAIVLVEHDVGLVMSVADEVIVMNEGHIIARGEPADIERNQDVRTAYLGAANG